MKKYREIISILLLLFIISCNSDKKDYFIQTEYEYQTIDGKEVISSQVIKSLRNIDSLPISTLTKVPVSKKENDFKNFLLDSIYYDEFGNDTFSLSYVYLNNYWQPAQLFRKKYRSNKQISYFMTERPFNEGHYYKQEMFYSYNKLGKIISQTRVLCNQKNICDSTDKEKYIYNEFGEIDTTVILFWKENGWFTFEELYGSK